jgi:hypothetical protein
MRLYKKNKALRDFCAVIARGLVPILGRMDW